MARVITTTIHTNVRVIRDTLGQIVNTLIVTAMVVRMAQRVSTETLAIHVNVLMVFWVIIAKHGIFVITKAVLKEERVLMENIIILAVVVVVIMVITVNITIALIIYVKMGALAKVV